MAITFTSDIKFKNLMQTSQLEEKLSEKGLVIKPDDERFDIARKGWNLIVDQFPALIVQVKNERDIVESILFAKPSGLEVMVMATGHGVIRNADNCLLVDTSKMTNVQVNEKARTAWVEAGAKWKTILEKAQAVGLAPLLGSSPDIGAVGYTLGGGMGWLVRKYGLSTDSVNFFEVVSAEGKVFQASAETNPDLFWALRGGGGNFGVVSGMEIRLYPVTDVYAGNLLYPMEKAKEVFAHYREWIEEAPDELTSSVVLMNFPPFPSVPDFLKGKSFVMVRGCFCGSVADGEELIKFWREWQKPFIDEFKPISFADVATISNDPIDPIPAYTSGAWLRDLDDSVMENLINYVVPRDHQPVFLFAEIRNAGGAISKVDPKSAAYSNRDAKFSLQVTAVVPTPEAYTIAQEQIKNLKEMLKTHLHGGVYLNFLEGLESREHTREGFSVEAFKRLQQVKKKYDPNNMFSHSYNILPSE